MAKGIEHSEITPKNHCNADKTCKRNHIYQQACHVVEFSALNFIYSVVCERVCLFNVRASNVSKKSKEEEKERRKKRKTHTYTDGNPYNFAIHTKSIAKN